MGLNKNFWKGKRVLVTGHTGFKGSWITFWLNRLGAKVKGIALPPETTPNLFTVLKLKNQIDSVYGDIRNLNFLKNEVRKFDPEIIFHMAAQAIVRTSYDDPISTFQINVIGTANLFEAARDLDHLRAFISVTSDKCYENNEWVWKYRENDAMGGWDPYSASKGCAELITSSYRRSFFQSTEMDNTQTGIASVRAGNVIGGGDWSRDRLIPDIMRAFSEKRQVIIRNPNAVRPWQYILDLLNGYLILAERLYSDGDTFSEAWNFGPAEKDEQSVEYITNQMIRTWGEGVSWKIDQGNNPHEANYLKLDSSKARMRLKWKSVVSLDQSLQYLTTWYKSFYNHEDMIQISEKQIREFEKQTNNQ